MTRSDELRPIAIGKQNYPEQFGIFESRTPGFDQEKGRERMDIFLQKNNLGV